MINKGMLYFISDFIIFINQQYFTDVIFSVTCNALLHIFSTSRWNNRVKYFYRVFKTQPNRETLFMSYWWLWQCCTSYFGCFGEEANCSSCSLRVNVLLLLWCKSSAELKAYRLYRNLVCYPVSSHVSGHFY